MQIVTGRRGEPHVTSRQMQAVYRSFLGDFALLDIGEKLRAEAYSNDIVRVYDGVVSVQGIYAVISYNQYDEVYIEPVSVGKKRIDTIVLHYTKNNTLDVEDMQLDVVQGEEYTDNPIAPVVPEGGDAWEGTTDIQVAIYDVEVTNFGLTVTPYARMLNLIPTLESIAERIPETVVTGVKGDSEVLYRDGDVNITKANIGLGNVDNTADTDKPISTATQTALNLKADLTYVDAKISAAYHAGGSKTVAELTSALLIADNIGKVFNMSDSGVTTSDFVEGAGKPINEGDNVGICNVGTEESPVYKFDLLSGFVDLSAYVTTTAMNTALADKVDKVAGKGLSTEDYTTTEKIKLAGISEGATQTIANPADTATETLSKLEVGGVVYDVPQGASGATELSELTDVNLTDVEDNNILQYDETANKWKNSNALQGAKTTTGNPLTIEDAAPVNAVNLSMDLEPVQDLHGYDHPWVGGAGKNKVNPTANPFGISAGTGAPNYEPTSHAYVTKGLAGETVTVSRSNHTSSGYFWYGAYAETALEGGLTPLDYGDMGDNLSATISVPVGTDMLVIFTGADEPTNLQVEIGSTVTSFAPYSNICSISGRSEVAIQRVGKNKLPMTVDGIKAANTDGTWSGNTYSINNGSLTIQSDSAGNVTEITANGTFNAQTLFYCKMNALSVERNVIYNGVSDGSADSYSINLLIGEWFAGDVYDGDSNICTIPPNTETLYIIVLRNGYNAQGVTFYPMIRLATDTDSSFEPYAGKTYTIQIGQTVYGGQLDVTKGKMVVTHGYAEYDASSDEAWIEYTVTQGSLYRIINTNRVYGDLSTDAKAVCNECPVVVNSQRNLYTLSGENNNIDIILSQSTSFTDWLASHPLQVCYELATPFTIDLTPQQIKLLENTNTIYTDYEGDTITIEYQPNNAIGEAVRAVEESYDPEFAVRPVLKKKAFSGTTDSDGAVTLINASDIPSGHKIIPLHITDMTIDGNAGTYFVEYKPYNSGDSVKGYCYTYHNGSQITPVGTVVTGNFYYYDLEV